MSHDNIISGGWLPYLPLGSTPDVPTLLVPAFDDDSTPPIPIPTGFPIGNTIQSIAFVSTLPFCLIQ